jgi:hypothetical protein
VPTQLPRHTITETPDVRAALDELRREIGEQRVPLAELVIIGAEEKVRRLQAARAREDQQLAALAERIRRREPIVDPAAAEQVHRMGWLHE